MPRARFKVQTPHMCSRHVNGHNVTSPLGPTGEHEFIADQMARAMHPISLFVTFNACPACLASADKPHHTLQVQALRLALLFRAQYSLPSSAEVGHLHPHSALPERHQTGFGANGLDVGTRQVVLLRDKLLEIHVLVERHLAGMERKDLALGVLVGVLEQDLAVDTTRTYQGRVKRLDLVRGHDHLDVSAVVETIELVEELQHSPLHFTLATRGRFVALGANSVNFVDKDDRWGVFRSNL